MSDDSEQTAGNGSSQEATSSDDEPKPQKRVANGKNQKRMESDDSDIDHGEDSQNVAPKSTKSRTGGAVNKGATAKDGSGAGRLGKSSSESQGSTNSMNSGSGASAGAGVIQPRKPLQPGAGAGQQPRSPFRTVSLNDSSSSASNSAARRRLSGTLKAGFNGADTRRRQSLPSALWKNTVAEAAAAAADGDSSFASSNGASPMRRPVNGRRSGGLPGPLNATGAPPLRRTSAGFALQGKNGALPNHANALRRNASGTSNGAGAGDLTAAVTLPMPEILTSNYEEWMKLATDNVSSVSISDYRGIVR